MHARTQRCATHSGAAQVDELQQEVNSLREVLVEKYKQVAVNLEGGGGRHGAR